MGLGTLNFKVGDSSEIGRCWVRSNRCGRGGERGCGKTDYLTAVTPPLLLLVFGYEKFTKKGGQRPISFKYDCVRCCVVLLPHMLGT